MPAPVSAPLPPTPFFHQFEAPQVLSSSDDVFPTPCLGTSQEEQPGTSTCGRHSSARSWLSAPSSSVSALFPNPLQQRLPGSAATDCPYFCRISVHCESIFLCLLCTEQRQPCSSPPTISFLSFPQSSLLGKWFFQHPSPQVMFSSTVHYHDVWGQRGRNVTAEQRPPTFRITNQRFPTFFFVLFFRSLDSFWWQ